MLLSPRVCDYNDKLVCVLPITTVILNNCVEIYKLMGSIHMHSMVYNN